MSSFIPKVQVLRGPPTPERQADAVNQAFQGLQNGIADGVLASGVTITVPTTLPGTVTVKNPLGRIAQGVHAVMKSQAVSIDLQSSTSLMLTLLVALVPSSKAGIITGLSPITGTLTVNLWIF